ncbi:MAG: hypothetical protein QM817_05980 [Archangium sp.]
MKSDLGMVFDFETDLATVETAQLRRVALLGIVIGFFCAVGGGVATLWLINWTGSVNKLSIAPGLLGSIFFANGLYRLIVGFIPVVARVAALRMGVMLLLLVAIGTVALGVLLYEP